MNGRSEFQIGLLQAEWEMQCDIRVSYYGDLYSKIPTLFIWIGLRKHIPHLFAIWNIMSAVSVTRWIGG